MHNFFKFIFLIIIIFYFLLNEFKLKNNLIIKSYIERKKNILIKFLDSYKLILLEKKELLEFLSKNVGKNITVVKSIFLGQSFHFGNQLIIIYKTIFYCQILGCKKIILDKNYNWYIKKDIINKNYKMIIKTKDRNLINKYDIIIDETTNFYFYYKYITPEVKINILRKEIINNLPKISINHNDLYIYIRSGDIFLEAHPNYRQPPFCFYKKVLENNKFKNIYLIAVNKNNPVINEILKNFPNIIYNFNSLEVDLSYLVNANNIAGGGTSTFLSNALELNNNSPFLWTFEFKNYSYTKYLKFNVISFYNISKLKIFLMYASNNYEKNMRLWNNTKIQRNLMINDKCTNPFVFINQKYNSL